MDLSYLIFRNAYLQLKNKMEWGADNPLDPKAQSTGVSKQSYQYWCDGDANHGCNLYRPAGKPAGLPLIIDIHGGGWIAGHKDVYDNFSYFLSSKGFNVSSLTYRTADIATLPEQVQDIFHYLHFLKDNEKELGISLDEVMLTGDSAGAQLSLLVSAINQSEHLQKIFDVDPVDLEFDSLILTHPVCFVEQAAHIPYAGPLSHTIMVPGLLKLLYGPDYPTDPCYLASFNPYQFLKEDMKFPPILILSSQADTSFAYQMPQLAQALTHFGIEHETYMETDPAAGHVYNIVEPFSPLGARANQYMLRFFTHALEKKKLARCDSIL